MSSIPSIDLTLEDSETELSPSKRSVNDIKGVDHLQSSRPLNLKGSDDIPSRIQGNHNANSTTVRLPGLSRMPSLSRYSSGNMDLENKGYRLDPSLDTPPLTQNSKRPSISLNSPLKTPVYIRPGDSHTYKRLKIDTQEDALNAQFEHHTSDQTEPQEHKRKEPNHESFSTDDFVTPQSPKFPDDILENHKTTPITSHEEDRDGEFTDDQDNALHETVEYYDLDDQKDENIKSSSNIQNQLVIGSSPRNSELDSFHSARQSPRPQNFENEILKHDGPINKESSPIIILSDDEDNKSTSYGDQSSADKPNNSNILNKAPDAETARAAFERLAREMMEKERELTNLQNTYRDTKTILQRKLTKREALIKESESKLDLLLKSLDNSQSSNKRLLIDRTAEDTKSLKEKKTKTLLKLREVERKESLLKEKFVDFVNFRNSKMQQSQVELQNAIKDQANTNNIQSRGELIQERSRTESMYREGSIDEERYALTMSEINAKLNRLNTSNTVQNGSATSLFFKSIEVARDLIQKNTVRSLQNKNLMNYLLRIVEKFKKDFDQGVLYKASKKRRVENAIVELQKHGVKMPAVSKYLETLGFIVDPDFYDRMKQARSGHNYSDDDFIPPEEMGENAMGDDSILGAIKSQHGQVTYNSLQLSNIYTAQDNESLHKLLEDLKKTETEVKGEELTPPELTVNLMTHQRQGLHWLLEAENSSKKGGLLADDMGLGKTVQAIALMLRNRSELEKCKTNLIVAPVAVLRVWQAEIKTKVKKSADFKVIIYGGTSGSKVNSWRELLKYEVVLVSYQTLASELKKHWPLRLRQDDEDFKLPEDADIKAINNLKEKGSEYWSPFFCNESQFYRIILDEAQNIKNKNTKAAKGCCALESVYRWALSGTPMQNSIMELYSLVRFLRISPYNREHKFRVDIGNPLGKSATNYDDYDKKQAMKKVQVLLRAIMLRRTKDSEIDGKPILELPDKNIHNEENVLVGEESKFYKELESANQKKAEKLLSRSAKGSYSSILTLLLRLRQACCHPELVVIGENKSENSKVVNGKNFERDWLRLFEVARSISNMGKDTISDGLENMMCPYCMEQMELESTMILTPCGHMLCEGCLESFLDDARFEPGARKAAGGGHIVACLVCKRDVNDNDVITYKLYDQVVNQHFTERDLHDEYKHEMAAQKDRLKNGYHTDLQSLYPSQKISKCLEIIRNIYEKTDDEKVIIFSQFTTFFDLLQHFIKKELRIPFLRYDGSMDSKARAVTVEDFYRDKAKRVLLISMKAGNAGLTLTCANHVVLVDPFWNPFVEDQAMDRCYRISQTREVQVYRLLVKNSVEDRILELQKKKRELVDSAMDPTKIREVNRLGRHELGFLFGLNSLGIASDS
ncbi:LAFE_0C07514g1_1 [Lachancea fermentati]|uniref:LAFE_0C07514g1_1 n=1 Tax=Lachancea fermentati TaxID=4955 RepID=A0A1G4MA54_LACFM|nr:LAFE_0C07514g1_1 [Lachancea fermentati]